MQLQQFIQKLQQDILPKAINTLNSCSSNQDAINCRKVLITQISSCLLDNEQPQECQDQPIFQKVRELLDARIVVELKLQSQLDTLTNEYKKIQDSNSHLQQLFASMNPQGLQFSHLQVLDKLDELKDKVTQIKNQGKEFTDEICLLIDEFIPQLEKEPISQYECGKQNHYSKFDLIGKIIKKYADFWHTHVETTTETRSVKYDLLITNKCTKLNEQFIAEASGLFGQIQPQQQPNALFAQPFGQTQVGIGIPLFGGVKNNTHCSNCCDTVEKNKKTKFKVQFKVDNLKL